MRSRSLVAIGAALVAAFAASIAFAAVPVEESQGTPVRSSTTPAAPSARPAQTYPAETYPAAQSYPAAQAYPVASTPVQSVPIAAAAAPGGGTQTASPTAELFTQLQSLQAEVSELRGIVEEQQHKIDQLERAQKEQYIDLDKRVAALRGAVGETGSTPTSSAGPSVVGASSGTTPNVGATGPVSVAAPSSTEKDAYTSAFNLTRDKRYQDAIDAFNQFLVQYPSGEYAGNAFYWLGENYLALPEPALEKARQSFVQVVNLYPSNAKVPDALYKLGDVFFRLGDRTKALQYFDQVQKKYPGTSAATLARGYADKIR